MGKAILEVGKAAPGCPFWISAQIRSKSGPDTPLVVRSDLSSIEWASYKVTRSGFTLVDSDTFTVSAVIYDTPQIGADPDSPDDAGWTLDDVGFNFDAEFPGSAFPEGNTDYLIKVELTFTGGDVLNDFYHLKTHNVPTS